MNNKKIEKMYLIHIALFILLFVILNNYYNFNIFDKTYEVIEEYKTYMLNEVDMIINNIENNPETYNMDEYAIAEYKIYNINVVNQSTQLLYYYMPAIYMLLILLLVIIENSIYRALKFKMLVESYDATKDKNKDKLRKIIIEKLNYKYRRITLPKHVCYMTVVLYIASLFISNEILLRTINNMVFALFMIVTVYGIRVAIRFFKTRNEIARALVIISNVGLSFMVPQMYFIIGLLQSMMTFKIIISKEKPESKN